MSLNEFLGKKYRFEANAEGNEQYSTYLKKFGVNLIIRQLLQTSSPLSDLQMDGNQYVLTTTSFKNTSLRFTPGIEFDRELINTKMAKTTITITGNTLHEFNTDTEGNVDTVDRTFTADELKVVLKFQDITVTRIYKAVT